MTSDSVERWAAICGLVRDEPGLLAKLDTLAAWRERGVIKDVVFSTWQGELDRYPALRTRLDAGEFVLIESAPPLVKAFGHTLHQSKALHYALQAIPAGAMVLKMRADLGALDVNVLEAITQTSLGPTDPTLPQVFDQRVLINASFVDSPYYLNDILLYGLRDDIARLGSFDLATEMLFSHAAPEQTFFRSAFAGVFPRLEAFLYIQPPLLSDDPEGARDRIRILLESDFYLTVLALNLRLMHGYFRLGFLGAQRREELPPLADGFDLEGLLTRAEGFDGCWLLPGTGAMMVMDERFLEAVIGRRFEMNAFGLRFARALDEVASMPTGGPAPNALTPDPAVRDLQRRLMDRIGILQPRMAAETTGRHFTVQGHADRFGLTVDADSSRALHEEINQMRRELDRLRARLGDKG